MVNQKVQQVQLLLVALRVVRKDRRLAGQAWHRREIQLLPEVVTMPRSLMANRRGSLFGAVVQEHLRPEVLQKVLFPLA